MCKIYVWKFFVLQLWSLTSSELALGKMKRDEYLEAQGKKNFTDAVKNDFLCKVYKYLKVSMQKIFLEMFFYQTVWHLISLKPVLAKKEESDYFAA